MVFKELLFTKNQESSQIHMLPRDAILGSSKTLRRLSPKRSHSTVSYLLTITLFVNHPFECHLVTIITGELTHVLAGFGHSVWMFQHSCEWHTPKNGVI